MTLKSKMPVKHVTDKSGKKAHSSQDQYVKDNVDKLVKNNDAGREVVYKFVKQAYNNRSTALAREDLAADSTDYYQPLLEELQGFIEAVWYRTDLSEQRRRQIIDETIEYARIYEGRDRLCKEGLVIRLCNDLKNFVADTVPPPPGFFEKKEEQKTADSDTYLTNPRLPAAPRRHPKSPPASKKAVADPLYDKALAEVRAKRQQTAIKEREKIDGTEVMKVSKNDLFKCLNEIAARPMGSVDGIKQYIAAIYERKDLFFDEKNKAAEYLIKQFVSKNFMISSETSRHMPPEQKKVVESKRTEGKKIKEDLYEFARLKRDTVELEQEYRKDILAFLEKDPRNKEKGRFSAYIGKFVKGKREAEIECFLSAIYRVETEMFPEDCEKKTIVAADLWAVEQAKTVVDEYCKSSASSIPAEDLKHINERLKQNIERLNARHFPSYVDINTEAFKQKLTEVKIQAEEEQKKLMEAQAREKEEQKRLRQTPGYWQGRLTTALSQIVDSFFIQEEVKQVVQTEINDAFTATPRPTTTEVKVFIEAMYETEKLKTVIGLDGIGNCAKLAINKFCLSLPEADRSGAKSELEAFAAEKVKAEEQKAKAKAKPQEEKKFSPLPLSVAPTPTAKVEKIAAELKKANGLGQLTEMINSKIDQDEGDMHDLISAIYITLGNNCQPEQIKQEADKAISHLMLHLETGHSGKNSPKNMEEALKSIERELINRLKSFNEQKYNEAKAKREHDLDGVIVPPPPLSSPSLPPSSPPPPPPPLDNKATKVVEPLPMVMKRAPSIFPVMKFFYPKYESLPLERSQERRDMPERPGGEVTRQKSSSSSSLAPVVAPVSLFGARASGATSWSQVFGEEVSRAEVLGEGKEEREEVKVTAMHH